MTKMKNLEGLSIVGGSKPNFFTGNNLIWITPHLLFIIKLVTRFSMLATIFLVIMRSFQLAKLIVEELNDELKALANLEAEKFIEAGYPQELAKLEFDPNFVIRGLLVDRNRGNLLKVDGHKYVKIAFHGKQRLTKKERHETYNRDGIKAEDFLSIDTFFALSEVQLFIEIVDYMRLNPGVVNKSFVEVYDDLRDFIDLSHRDGSIKNEVLANLSEYFYKDHNTAKTLIGLREAGKKVFLLTNSHHSLH